MITQKQNDMKKYNIITTHKLYEVESNAIVAPLMQLFGQLSEGEEPLAVIREDFNSGTNVDAKEASAFLTRDEYHRRIEQLSDHEWHDAVCLVMEEYHQHKLEQLQKKRLSGVDINERAKELFPFEIRGGNEETIQRQTAKIVGYKMGYVDGERDGMELTVPKREDAQERYEKAEFEIPGDIFDDEYGEYNRKQVYKALRIAAGLPTAPEGIDMGKLNVRRTIMDGKVIQGAPFDEDLPAPAPEGGEG